MQNLITKNLLIAQQLLEYYLKQLNLVLSRKDAEGMRFVFLTEENISSKRNMDNFKFNFLLQGQLESQ